MQVAWPLGLLLTPEVLSTYNILFRYLVRLKQVEMDLQEVWTWMKVIDDNFLNILPLLHANLLKGTIDFGAWLCSL